MNAHHKKLKERIVKAEWQESNKVVPQRN
jgi:hypothetical protein